MQMEPGMRSGGPAGVVVKNRNSSGCLIVRKKGDGMGGGVGSSSSRKLYQSKKVKKRSSVALSDSGSSDELLMPPTRRVGPETIRVCNGLTAFERGMIEGSEFGRKRDRMEQIGRNEDDMIDRSGLEERERKRSKLDVFDFNEYDGMDSEDMQGRHFEDNGVGFGGRGFMGSMHAARGGIEREFESGSSRHIPEKRKNSYYDRGSNLYLGDNAERRRFKINRDGPQMPVPLLREKFVGNSEESIRVQGKNGVLKVRVKNKVGGPLERFDHRKPVESRQTVRTEGSAKRNAFIHPPSYPETKLVEKPKLVARPEKKHFTSRKSLSSKDSKGDDGGSENSDTSLNPGLKSSETRKPVKKASSEDEQTPLPEILPTTRMKEGKVRRGSGTEKQKLRERIREMLLGAGWSIDYRPRRNRDYLDAVYINPAGTAYWSIIKAYDALQKQLNDDGEEAKAKGDSSSFAPIADEVLSQLTRKTRKKMEKELKRELKKNKKRNVSESDSEKEPRIKGSPSSKRGMNSMDSDSNEEKLSSFIKQGAKSAKSKMIENAAGYNSNDGAEKPFSGSDSHRVHGRKSRKHGRCTLLVRGSKKGLNSESDGFVPYTGKRTVLSWLIDSGTVQLSQKVQYRKRKRVMLEGWVTRDGIHCGCCSKILTVSKFEIHAGSKLRQPFQNIYLDSGVSLLQCQIDAWNSQKNSDKIAFYSVDIDGDDPNDDTCGICGDGGDLICCDGCPSTFHQNCLDIQMLPPGDWHCPNCTCKICGIAGEPFRKGDDATVYALYTCDLCQKKYHVSCTKEMNALPVDSDTPDFYFCGKECKELFEHLKKYLGTKHELEAGFSWSLIRRTDEDSEAASRGISQRVESNSKLAVALTVMDECFLPVVDRRSGINLIHNVLYNSGSNFSRLNYTGFYTAILERGDEIICAASLRFHGTKLAEMPFIGTRHVYRRQGMCRRLFSAIELALFSLKVEKLVIPAIAELMHTWTTIFGFKSLEESLRQEMKSLNMLVFPGIDMLQKLLVKDGKHKGNAIAAGDEQIENREKHTRHEKENRSDIDSPAQEDPNSGNDESSDASQEVKNKDLVESPKSNSRDRLADSASDRCVSPSRSSDSAPEMENKVGLASSMQDAPDYPRNHALAQGSASSDPNSGGNLVESVSDRKYHSPAAMECDSLELENNTMLNSHLVENTLPSKNGDANDTLEGEAIVSGVFCKEKMTRGINDNTHVSGSTLHHTDECSLQINSDMNGERSYGEDRELGMNTEITSDGEQSDEGDTHDSGDSSETESL